MPKQTYYTRVIEYNMLLDFASTLGGDVEKIKQSANIHPTNIYYGDYFIEYGTLCNIYNDVAKQSKLSSFFIDMAMSFPSSMPQLGAYTALRSFSKTVKDWYLLGEKYLKLHTNAIAFKMLEDADSHTFTLQCHVATEIPNYHQMLQYNLVLIYRSITENITSPHRLPIQVRLPGNEDNYHKKIKDLIKSKILFEADEFELVFDRALLREPVNAPLSLFKNLAETYIKYQTDDFSQKEISKTTYASAIISSLFGTGRCNIEQVANILDLSSKSLQRELQKEGTTFSEILDEYRKNTAFIMLKKTQIPISQIAVFLDYSSPKSFSLACKRWAGKSPSEFRDL